MNEWMDATDLFLVKTITLLGCRKGLEPNDNYKLQS